MSIRNYQPRRRDRRGATTFQTIFLYAILALAIGLQIAYPLVHGDSLLYVTIATVYSAAGLMIFHSWISYGARYAITYLVVGFFGALLIEHIGLTTGWPFGKYSYDASLGATFWKIPLIVPFAWLMICHPMLIIARRFTSFWVFLYGGIGLMAWDLFLDPQMVSAHRWTWEASSTHVPFQPEIPLSNAAGWLFAGMGLMALLHFLLPKERRKIGANSAAVNIFLEWTLFSGIIGNLFFFHRPGVALIGGLVMGAVLLPYLFTLRMGRPESV